VAVTEFALNLDIEMPPPYGVAPAPGHRWDTAVDFAVENTRALIGLWIAKRHVRRDLPAFSQFDSLELRPWLDNLIVLDAKATVLGGRDYTYRSVGSAAAAVEGGNFAGLNLRDALPAAQAEPRLQFYDRALRTRGPVEIHRRIPLGDDAEGPRSVQWDAVALPLSRDQLYADHLMVLTYVEALG
jgi:hypothetical protein